MFWCLVESLYHLSLTKYTFLINKTQTVVKGESQKENDVSMLELCLKTVPNRIVTENSNPIYFKIFISTETINPDPKYVLYTQVRGFYDLL